MSLLILLGDLAPLDLRTITIAPSGALPAGALTLANLEVPCCPANIAPSAKAGPQLRADPAILPGLAAAWPGLAVTLANNHSMDFGADGLTATLTAAAAAGLRPFGAGPTHAAAAAPLVLTLGGLRVGLLAATERWFGLATADTPGVCALNPATVDRVRALRPTVDRVIVSVHGGGEMSPWPAPAWQQTLRGLITAGADVVHAHHPHVPLGWERWQQGWIFYGLGNTVVNPTRWTQSPAVRRSWRAELDLTRLDAAPAASEWECFTAGDAGGELRCIRPSVTGGDPAVTELNLPLADPLLLEGLHQEYALRLWEHFYADRLNLGDTPARRVRLAARTLRDTALALLAPERSRRQRRDRGLFHYHLFSADTHAGEIATALGVLHGERIDRRTPRTRALAERWLPSAHFAG